MTRLELKIDELPLLPNAKGQGRHWATEAKYRKRWYWLVRCAVGRSRPREPWKRARVTVVRHSAKAPDVDGLYASVKPLVDGLIHAGVIVDDSPSHIDLRCFWCIAPPRGGSVWVEVEPVEDP